MKINELKINNTVEHKLDGIITITGIVDDDKGLIRCGKGNWLWVNDIAPVYITRDYMSRLGFRQIGDVAEWELPIKGAVEEITIGVDFQKKGKYAFAVCIHDDISNQIIQAEIMYIHELQNLIHAVAYGSKILSNGEVVW